MKKFLLFVGAIIAWILPANAATDILTATNFGVNPTTGNVTYGDYTYNSDLTSAKYAGNIADNKDGLLQLRSNNSTSGIVSTTSGGTLVSVKITWGSGNSNGRTLNIYGSNNAYTSASDLYNKTTSGTLVTSLNVNNAVDSESTYTFETDYEYIGIRSSSGAIYVASIEIEWSAASGVEAPTFNPKGGIVTKGANVTLDAASGLTVIVATATMVGETPTKEQVINHGTETKSITVNADETYFAVAMDDNGNLSSVAKATFVVVNHAGSEDDPYTVADAIKVANANGTSSSENKYVTGYVCDNPTENSDGSYTFSMTDNEDLTGDQFKAYKVTSSTAMEQGSKVVVCGPICMYGKTPEVNTGLVTSVTGNQILSFDPEVFAAVVFDCTVTKGTSTDQTADEMSRGCITVSSTSAGLNYETYRIYQGSTTTISSNLPITQIKFTADDSSNPPSTFSVQGNNGKYDKTNYVWTGHSKSIQFKPSAQVRMSKIEVEVDVTSFESAWTADEIYFDRTLATPANWQALCLPFEIADWTEYFSKVIEFDDAETVDGAVTLSFKSLATTDPIVAGKPYLFKSKEGEANIGIIAEKAEVVAASSLQNVGTTYVFHGNFEAVTDMTAAYGLAADGNFHMGSATAVLKPFRAYITTGAAKAPAKLKVAIDGQEVDGLDDVIFFEGENGATYNLKGIKVENPGNDIVIRNGKKVFVK